MKSLTVSMLSVLVFASAAVAEKDVKNSQTVKPQPEVASTTPASKAATDSSTMMETYNPLTSRKSALSVELLGRGLVYSINYDHMISDEISLGVGLSSFALSGNFLPNGESGTFAATVVPLYGNYYFGEQSHYAYVTGGLDLLFGSVSSSSVNGAALVLAPIAGGGYEYRGDAGFLFRASLYGILLGGKSSVAFLTLWGLSLGYAF